MKNVIFSDVHLNISFEGRRVQSAGEGVPQHGVGEGVRLGGVGLRPQEAKAGGGLSNGLGGCDRALHGLELEIQLCLSGEILGVTLVTGEPV